MRGGSPAEDERTFVLAKIGELFPRRPDASAGCDLGRNESGTGTTTTCQICGSPAARYRVGREARACAPPGRRIHNRSWSRTPRLRAYPHFARYRRARHFTAAGGVGRRCRAVPLRASEGTAAFITPPYLARHFRGNVPGCRPHLSRGPRSRHTCELVLVSSASSSLSARWKMAAGSPSLSQHVDGQRTLRHDRRRRAYTPCYTAAVRPPDRGRKSASRRRRRHVHLRRDNRRRLCLIRALFRELDRCEQRLQDRERRRELPTRREYGARTRGHHCRVGSRQADYAVRRSGLMGAELLLQSPSIAS